MPPRKARQGAAQDAPAARAAEDVAAAVEADWAADEFGGNGPVRVGVGIGSDNPPGDLCKLPRNDNSPVLTIMASVARILDTVNAPDAIKTIVLCLASRIAANSDRAEDDAFFIAEDLEDVPTVAEVQQISAKTNDRHMQETAMTLLVATKVNWWQINHHVGTPKPAGFYAKVSRAAFERLKVPFDDAVSHEIIWAACHWFDTKGILAACGIPIAGIDPVAARALHGLSELGDDVILRIRACPAGSARVADTYAAMMQMKSGPIGAMIYHFVEKFEDEVKAAHAEVLADPVSFHVGALYLGARVRKSCPEIPAGLMRTLAAYVDTFHGGSSLSRAKALFAHSGEKGKESEESLIFKPVITAIRRMKIDIDTRKIVPTAAADDARPGPPAIEE